MQWPPTPGPGVKRMNPNGLVAAASMTSQTSTPIRSHSSASWLTRAIFTLRKTFSRSLASSAASGELSSTTLSLMWRRRAAARVVGADVVPPTRRGTVFVALAGSPGLTRSGANASSKSRPATRPERSSSARNGPAVVPGNVVDWRTTSWPRQRCSRTSAAALRTGPRSGSLAWVMGVGTHTKTASAASRAASSGDTIRKPAANPRWRRIVDVVDRRAAGVELVDAAGARVHAGDVEAGFAEREGQRQANVAEADNGDAGVGVHREEDRRSGATRSTRAARRSASCSHDSSRMRSLVRATAASRAWWSSTIARSAVARLAGSPGA